MAEYSTEEGTHITDDGQSLYTKTWKPAGDVKAYLVFVHGFSDHCNRYGPLFPTLASKGIEVRSWDQRGWGRSVMSQSDKGLTGSTARVLGDMSSFLRSLIPARPNPSAPIFLMGHSMGGAQTLTYIAVGPREVTSHLRGYLVEGPFIALHPATRPSAFTVFAGRLAGRVLPRHQLVNPVDPQWISRDEAVQRDYMEDELCHDTGTLEGLAGMLDRASNLEDGRVIVPKDAGEGAQTRLWVSHGTADRVCDFNATKQLYDRLDDGIEKECKWYDGWYHQLHMDLPEDRISYANDVADWILARLGPGTRPQAKL